MLWLLLTLIANFGTWWMLFLILIEMCFQRWDWSLSTVSAAWQWMRTWVELLLAIGIHEILLVHVINQLRDGHNPRRIVLAETIDGLDAHFLNFSLPYAGQAHLHTLPLTIRTRQRWLTFPYSTKGKPGKDNGRKAHAQEEGHICSCPDTQDCPRGTRALHPQTGIINRSWK